MKSQFKTNIVDDFFVLAKELKQLDNIELNLDGEVNGTIKNEGDSISRE